MKKWLLITVLLFGMPMWAAIGSKEFTIRVNPAQLVITTQKVPRGAVGIWYQAYISATGGIPPLFWTVISGTMPPGLSLTTDSNGNGVISGIPTQAGDYEFDVQVADSAGSMNARWHVDSGTPSVP